MTRFGHSQFKKLEKRLFYGEILLILIEGFLDFTIAFFIYVFYDPEKNFELSYMVCLITFFMAFMILPAVLIQLISKNESTLKKEEFKQEYGSLYEELRIKERLQVAFYLFFICRRFIFVFVSLYLRDQSYF